MESQDAMCRRQDLTPRTPPEARSSTALSPARTPVTEAAFVAKALETAEALSAHIAMLDKLVAAQDRVIAALRDEKRAMAERIEQLMGPSC